MILIREDGSHIEKSGDRVYRLHDEETDIEVRVEQYVKITTSTFHKDGRLLTWDVPHLSYPLRGGATVADVVALTTMFAMATRVMLVWEADTGERHPHMDRVGS